MYRCRLRRAWGTCICTSATSRRPWIFITASIGFDVMGVAKPFRMAFVSAGGYHHHIGLNTWQGEGAAPAPDGSVGLRYFNVVVPDQAELERVIERIRDAAVPMEQTEAGLLVHDPSQNGVIISARTE